jgi:threonine synthase
MHSLIDRYRDRLPVGPSTPVVSLGEGSTPLLHAPRISRRLGVELYLKLEGANPTGSFKDRGMTVAMSKAVEGGAQAVICASTGNTPASAAAYAARAGITAVVLQPAGAVASGKLAQARALGARVLDVRGSFDEALSPLASSAREGRTSSSTRSTRTGSRARRPRPSRSWRSSARLRTCSHSRTAVGGM